jgi:hypothetical protein
VFGICADETLYLLTLLRLKSGDKLATIKELTGKFLFSLTVRRTEDLRIEVTTLTENCSQVFYQTEIADHIAAYLLSNNMQSVFV